ncbi:ROK family transcriptional regulator [Actinoallomurus iriomotensis]|uniref:Sugar kinase n=1 Tax=Actinoallomurus iriomotensis TaxID=478107 RepID=A0A9W6VY27_9ACTN|nr:ROK family transcriptional regulator [Actinoallomurus iriomotensis]GLY82431.1 sugar kinase [Actinoallomurus iriomotensis]
MRHEVEPLRHGTMRERNLAVVLGEIARRQPVSRARLAEATGFTKTTVSSLVASLAGAGLVREDGPVRDGERGRPATAVSVNGDRVAGLGLEINVDYLAACVLDLGRRIRHRHIVAADNRDRAPERVIAGLTGLAARAISAAGEQGLSVAGAVVALPGTLDQGGGRLRSAPNLGWDDVPAGELLDAGLPALPLAADYDNEANLAALGELWFGDGPALGSYVHVSGEIGIGAGIVVDGRVFRGAHGFAGELGHVVVEPGGPPCACGGRGCLEQVAGQEAILRGAGIAAVTATSSASPDGPLSALVARLERGDERALTAVRRAGEALGQALATAVNLLDPDTIVLGGIFSGLAPWARPATEAALADGAGLVRRSPPRLTVSRLGGDAAALGAASLVVERVLDDPSRLVTRC